MATLAEIQKAATPANILPGWGYFMGGNPIDRIDSPEALAFMQSLKGFDPNASWQKHEDTYGGEGGSGGGNATYTLNYDKTKLPGGDRPAMRDMNHGAFAGFTGNPDSGDQSVLFNRDAIKTDPNGYGLVTSPRNVNNRAIDDDGYLKYGPLVIAAIASLGAAAPALAAGNATLSSFSTGAGGSLANGIVGAGRAAGNGDWLSALTSMAGPALGGMGVDPMLTGAGTTLARILASQGQPNNGARGGRPGG